MAGLRRAQGLAVLLLAATACGGGGGGGATSGLVKWAEGSWHCDMTLADDPGASAASVEGEVKAEGSDHGTFTLELSHEGVPAEDTLKATGDWSLDGRKLKVTSDLLGDISRYAMDGASLDTDKIEIQEQAPGADLQPVDVKRKGDEVTFSWTHPNTGAASLTCTKS